MEWILKKGKTSSFSCGKKESENKWVDLNEYRQNQKPVREEVLVHSSDQSV